MNNITNLQAPGNVNLQQSAPQQSSSSQSSAFNSPGIPQQVTSSIQHLLSPSKEGKTGEHAEQTIEHLNSMEDDFQSDINENSEILHTEEKAEAGQRDGGNQQSEGEFDEETAEAALVTQIPVSVSGGGITVGLSSTLRPIPNSRVIAIQGQNYTVAFLKRQVGNFASSSFAGLAQDADASALTQAALHTAWGGANVAGSGAQFEAYIRNTFPDGDPGLRANPVARYEGSSLIVAGQAYGADLNNPKLVGSADSFLIGNAPEHQAEVRQILSTFEELSIVNEIRQADGRTSYMVSAPTEYYGQWQAALLDNLPAGSTIATA